MSPPAEPLPALVAAAGYGRREPVIVGVHRQGRVPAFAAQGVTGAREMLGAAVVTYAASLSKQITAACAALLARVPDLNASLVILALADDTERRVDLAARLLDLVTADVA